MHELHGRGKQLWPLGWDWSSWCDSVPVRADLTGADSQWPQGLPCAATSPALPSPALAHPVQGASLQHWDNSQMSNTLSVPIICRGQGQSGTQTQFKMHKNNDLGKSKWKTGCGKGALKDSPNYKLLSVLCCPVFFIFLCLSFFFLSCEF